MSNESRAEFMTTGEVARLAEPSVSTELVRVWERSGRLPAIRTASGTRLFRRADVERFLSRRMQRAASSAADQAAAK